MSALRQSATWWTFVPEPLSAEQFLRTIADIGYQGVELVPMEYWPLVKDYGLQMATYKGMDSITTGFNRREQHDQLVREVEANIRLAEQWAIPALICFSGNRAGLDDHTGALITAEGLARVAPMAERAGVTLILELLNSKVDHPDYQCDHTAWGLEVCRLVGSPNVKLLYDIYHMQVMEGDIMRTIQTAHPLIGHYHTAGNPGRHELDQNQELSYSAILQTIAATDYTGYVGHEFLPTYDPACGLQAAFEMGAAAG